MRPRGNSASNGLPVDVALVLEANTRIMKRPPQGMYLCSCTYGRATSGQIDGDDALPAVKRQKRAAGLAQRRERVTRTHNAHGPLGVPHGQRKLCLRRRRKH